MRPDTTALLNDYDSAVLTGFDRSGLPVSLRCVPIVGEDGTLHVEIPSWADLVEGRAGLLAHFHDERLWHQRSFICRGRIVKADESWRFDPEITLIGMGHRPLGLVRSLLEGRRRAKAYLERRGWERPTVPWALMQEVKREAFRTPR